MMFLTVRLVSVRRPPPGERVPDDVICLGDFLTDATSNDGNGPVGLTGAGGTAPAGVAGFPRITTDWPRSRPPGRRAKALTNPTIASRATSVLFIRRWRGTRVACGATLQALT